MWTCLKVGVMWSLKDISSPFFGGRLSKARGKVLELWCMRMAECIRGSGVGILGMGKDLRNL
jgi:hypothetical protein